MIDSPTKKATKKKAAVPVTYKGPELPFKAPKYRIAELIRKVYGELNVKLGKEQLANYCGLRNERTINEWLSIEAGESTSINHLVLPKVLHFFELQTESQLFTNEHNILLNKTA